MRHCTHITLSVLLVLVWLSRPVAGQVMEEIGTPSIDAHAEVGHVCVTTLLLAEEAVRLDKMPTPEETAAAVSRLLRPSYVIGDTATFQVRQKVLLQPSEQEWEDQKFVLKAAGEIVELPGVGYQIWVEAGELQFGYVQAAQIAQLEEAIAVRTPDASINPTLGILANNISTFGDPPNIDGDGLVDILLTDVVEGTDGATVAGFFDPNDQNTLQSNSNAGDILYLDTRPSIAGRPDLSGLLQTAAHELQHLIHWKQDRTEQLFVNEGQSEWAQVLNGYGIRNATYLKRGDRYTNVRLVSWDDEEELFPEYQRAGLWASYIADQFGPVTAGAVTREPEHGVSGYRNVLANTPGAPSLADFVLDFHTANLVNDPDLDSRFAYFAEALLGVAAVPSLTWSGGAADRMDPVSFSLQPGGVVYLEWRSVKDFLLTTNLDSSRAFRVGMRLVVWRSSDTTPDWIDLDPAQNEHQLTGSYDRILGVITRTDLLFGETPIQVSAEWAPLEVSVVEVQVADTKFNLAFRISDTVKSGYVTRFAVPEEDARLSRVWLPNYFVSQFLSDQPPDTQRDFRFIVLADDGTGRPGDEIIRIDVDDDRAYEGASSQIPVQFYEMDLDDYAAELSELPDTVYIGSLNKPSATDENDLVVVTSLFTDENVTFIRGYSGVWERMWDIGLQSGSDLSDNAAPVRAEFVIGERAVAVGPVLPETSEDALLGNYPNPFTSRTRLSWSVAAAGDVSIDIFDVTGRRIGNLVDGHQFAGTHTVEWDGSGWAPGIYACVMQTSSSRQIRMISIVR